MEGRITISFVLVGLALALVGGAGTVGALGDELHNETVAVDNDTASVYVELTNTSNESVRVIFDALDENGSATEVKNVTASAAANDTTTVKYSDVDATNYTDYRVRVYGISNSTVETVTVGTLQKVAGGGAGGDGVGGTGLGLGVVVILVVGFLVLKD